MAGHAPKGVPMRTVDYKGDEHSKPIHSEFHHITSAVPIGADRSAIRRASARSPFFYRNRLQRQYLKQQRERWKWAHPINQGGGSGIQN